MSSYDKNSPFYEVDMKDLHPFGKLRITLMKTYQRACEDAPGKCLNSPAQSSSQPLEIL